MEEKKLYPLGFSDLEDNYPWGTETFKAADLGYRDSIVRNGWLAANTLSEIMDTYLDRVVGENVYEYYGRQFPVTIKMISVNGRMPLRVHPDDELAAQRYDLLGKEKLWYIIQAGKDATVSIGFRKDTGVSEFYEACNSNRTEELLNTIAPHSGQAFRIKPGTIHCATGSLLIAEVSEASPLDFCLCSRGQEISEDEFDSSLSLEDALDFIDFRPYRHDGHCCHHHHHHDDGDDIVSELADIPEFTVNRVKLGDTMHIYSSELDSFVAYLCIKGEASIQMSEDGKTADYALKEGGLLLIPAECPDFFLARRSSEAELLEVLLKKREETDSYINPDAEEHLPDEDCECGCDCAS